MKKMLGVSLILFFVGCQKLPDTPYEHKEGLTEIRINDTIKDKYDYFVCQFSTLLLQRNSSKDSIVEFYLFKSDTLQRKYDSITTISVVEYEYHKRVFKNDILIRDEISSDDDKLFKPCICKTRCN